LVNQFFWKSHWSTCYISTKPLWILFLATQIMEIQESVANDGIQQAFISWSRFNQVIFCLNNIQCLESSSLWTIDCVTKTLYFIFLVQHLATDKFQRMNDTKWDIPLSNFHIINILQVGQFGIRYFNTTNGSLCNTRMDNL